MFRIIANLRRSRSIATMATGLAQSHSRASRLTGCEQLEAMKLHPLRTLAGRRVGVFDTNDGEQQSVVLGTKVSFDPEYHCLLWDNLATTAKLLRLCDGKAPMVGPVIGSKDDIRAIEHQSRRRLMDVSYRESVQAQIADVQGQIAQEIIRLSALGITFAIILYTEGGDGTGKTSSGQLILDGLAAGGYQTRTQAFGAPTKEEQQGDWLCLFKEHVPMKPGQVIRWDRGVAGRFVYDSPSPEQRSKKLREWLDLQSKWATQNIWLFKIGMVCSRHKLAAVLGKRQARMEWAQQSLIPDLNATRELYDELALGIGKPDLMAFLHHRKFTQKFEEFMVDDSQINPWHRIDSSERLDARLMALKLFLANLKARSP